MKFIVVFALVLSLNSFAVGFDFGGVSGRYYRVQDNGTVDKSSFLDVDARPENVIVSRNHDIREGPFTYESSCEICGPVNSPQIQKAFVVQRVGYDGRSKSVWSRMVTDVQYSGNQIVLIATVQERPLWYGLSGWKRVKVAYNVAAFENENELVLESVDSGLSRYKLTYRRIGDHRNK
jgi:hypothetical protein